MHLDFDNAVAGACLAPAAFHIEGKAVGLVAARLGLGRLGEHIADQVEHAGVGGGIGTRRASDGRLVDVNHLVQQADVLDAIVRAGAGSGAVEVAGKHLAHDFVDQRGLARARHARDAGKHAQWNLHIDILQIVLAGIAHDELAGGIAAGLGNLDASRARKKLPGQGIGIAHDLLGRAASDNLTAMHARARSNIHNIVRRAHGVLVVLDHNHGVSQVAQVLERAQQPVVVALM